MQGKGLIKQLYRPTDTAITSKTLHSTSSQSVISPIAENHVNDTSVNDVINKPIPAINRSLPATPMTGINTTPRVLTIGNSFLNGKFESFEPKLYEKVVAMKSYFIDVLRSLKNETTVNKNQDCNINTKEITTLENKIKLLELEKNFFFGNKNTMLTNKNSSTQHCKKIRNSVETLMLVLLTLLHTRQGSNHLKYNITRKWIPS